MARTNERLGALLADLAHETGRASSEPKYSIILKDQLEYLIDRAPVDEVERRTWTTIHRNEEMRIYAVVLRYSYCFPIYAVRTRFVAGRGKVLHEENDSGMYDEASNATSLTRQDIAWILGMDEDNCRSAVRRLEAKGSLRFDTAGRCALVPRPQVLPPERPQRSVLTSGEPIGLPKAIADRLERECAQLPEDVRTDFYCRALQVRAGFLGGLKEVRLREKNGYDELCTEARNLISLQRKSSEAQGSSSSSPGAGEPEPNSTTINDATTVDAPLDPGASANEFQDFKGALLRTFVEAGKGAPTPEQLAYAATTLPAEAHKPYIESLQPKIERFQHAGALRVDVNAFGAAWPFQREHRRRKHAEVETARLQQLEREQAATAEYNRLVKEELLADPFPDREEVERVLKENPELRNYKPSPEHVHAAIARRARQALSEIRRQTCPPNIKQEQRRRLAELERMAPSLVDDLKRGGTS